VNSCDVDLSLNVWPISKKSSSSLSGPFKWLGRLSSCASLCLKNFFSIIHGWRWPHHYWWTKQPHICMFNIVDVLKIIYSGQFHYDWCSTLSIITRVPTHPLIYGAFCIDEINTAFFTTVRRVRPICSYVDDGNRNNYARQLMF